MFNTRAYIHVFSKISTNLTLHVSPISRNYNRTYRVLSISHVPYRAPDGIRSSPLSHRLVASLLGVWSSARDRPWKVFAGEHDAIRPLLYPVPPGIRIKRVVHTRADRSQRARQSDRPVEVAFTERSPLAVSGPELQMISNRIARNIIRYVFHYWRSLSFRDSN